MIRIFTLGGEVVDQQPAERARARDRRSGDAQTVNGYRVDQPTWHIVA